MKKLTVRALGHALPLDVAPGLFSTQRIDEGTLLLLAHLPPGEPRRVLDLGCGYGALGLPVAAHFPDAEVHLVDRLLLAVESSKSNALRLGLPGARAYPSLGYRDVERSAPFDWILCNVPARIGGPFLAYMLSGARALLAPAGELRVVLIRDLAGPLAEVARERALPLARVADGPRHAVFALPAGPASPVDLADESIYARSVVAGGLERPYDIDEPPGFLEAGLPLLLDFLPRQPPARALFVRAGYGAALVPAVARWPSARAVALDPDLLAVAFARRNAERAGLSERIDARPALLPQPAGDGKFDLAVCVVSPPAGMEVARAEVERARSLVAPRGQVLVLALAKAKSWLPGAVPLAERKSYAVLQAR